MDLAALQIAAIVVLVVILAVLVYSRLSRAESQWRESRARRAAESPTASTADLKLDADGNLGRDIACLKCGYNLRGLQSDGRCPECGTGVTFSTQDDRLCFADPAWIEKLARGLNFNLWGLAIAAVGGWLCPGVVSVIGGLMAFYGAWLLTEPDPSGLDENACRTMRKVVRVALAVGLLGSFMGVRGSFTLGSMAGIAASLGRLIGEFAKFSYLAMLAMRIPDRGLARRARFIRWAYPIPIAVVLVVGLVRFLPITRGSAMGFSILVFQIARIAGFICLLMALHLQWRLRGVLRDGPGVTPPAKWKFTFGLTGLLTGLIVGFLFTGAYFAGTFDVGRWGMETIMAPYGALLGAALGCLLGVTAGTGRDRLLLAGHCPCGYDLTGHVSTTCPKCGRKAEQSKSV